MLVSLKISTAPIAQLVEHWSYEPRVVSSNLTRSIFFMRSIVDLVRISKLNPVKCQHLQGKIRRISIFSKNLNLNILMNFNGCIRINYFSSRQNPISACRKDNFFCHKQLMKRLICLPFFPSKKDFLFRFKNIHLNNRPRMFTPHLYFVSRNARIPVHTCPAAKCV